MSKFTKQQAAEQALLVQDACNGTAIATLLHDVGRAWLGEGEGTDEAQCSAPFRLVLHKLCDLAGMTVGDGADYVSAYDDCLSMVELEEAHELV